MLIIIPVKSRTFFTKSAQYLAVSSIYLSPCDVRYEACSPTPDNVQNGLAIFLLILFTYSGEYAPLIFVPRKLLPGTTTITPTSFPS